MWILSFLPDWVFHLVTILGFIGTIAGFVLGMIPLIKQYIIPIRVISIVLLVFGVYLEGGLADNAIWEARVNEVKAKLAEAEVKSAKENVKIVEKVVKKTEYYKTRGDDIIQYIDREVTKYDSQCIIPKEFVKSHNDAATKEENPK
jgi:uncharacterized membrane protein